MNQKTVLYLLGKIMTIIGLLMLLPLSVDVYYTLHDFKEASYWSFLIPMLILFIIGGILLLKKPKQININAKEGLVICAIGWIIMSVIGALPFVISGSIPSYIDALFEAASGLSTTGSTILVDIESLPKSILFWRSFTHWIGGMGILSFMIAIVPKSKSNSMNIMKAEVPGPKAGKIAPKISQSAQMLYVMYSVLTVVEGAVLFFGSRATGDNLKLFDSVTTALSTAGTGGFGVLNNSIAGYHSPFVEWVCILFMFLFGVNFNLYFLILTRHFSSVFRDEEFRTYLFLNLASVTVIALNIMHMYNSIGTAVRDSFFAVNAVMSTTGFGTADFNTWPTFSKILLVCLMFVGGSVGSTGGGIKVTRIMLYFKQALCNLRLMTRPNTVIKVRINKRVVDEKTLNGVNAYLIVYISLIVISTLLISFNGFDTATTFTSVISAVNNIGPGLEMVGPTGNYSAFSAFSKLVLIFDMLAGRLEIFPIIALISPNTWRKTK